MPSEGQRVVHMTCLPSRDHSFKSASLLFNSIWNWKFHSGHILCFKGIVTPFTLYYAMGLALRHSRLLNMRHRKKCYKMLPVTLLEPITPREDFGCQMQISRSKAIFPFYFPIAIN